VDDTTLQELLTKFTQTNTYNFYYTHQQMVADFLDEHFDKNSDTLKLTDNIHQLENKKIHNKIETKYNSLIKRNIQTTQWDIINTHKTNTRLIKLIYISILALINKTKTK